MGNKEKTTKLGCDLMSCIRSGCDNLDSGVGVYASDAEAYVLFADLFNAVICDYHKLETLDGFKHPAQNFAFDDEFPADLDESGDYVVSTRIRVARNVAGYPLRGGMSEEQTMELEGKIKAILESMDDEDLKGKYYPLAGMDEKTREDLVADHSCSRRAIASSHRRESITFGPTDAVFSSTIIRRFWCGSMRRTNCASSRWSRAVMSSPCSTASKRPSTFCARSSSSHTMSSWDI